MLLGSVGFCDPLTHIRHGASLTLRQSNCTSVCEEIMKDMGKIKLYQTSSKYNTHGVCMFLGRTAHAPEMTDYSLKEIVHVSIFTMSQAHTRLKLIQFSLHDNKFTRHTLTEKYLCIFRIGMDIPCPLQ